MRAGALDRRITIMRVMSVPDESGFPVEQETAFAVVWAGIRQMSGREFMSDAAQTVAEERTAFTIRYRSDLLTTDAIEWEGRAFNIKFIRQLGRRRGLEIQAIARGDTP